MPPTPGRSSSDPATGRASPASAPCPAADTCGRRASSGRSVAPGVLLLDELGEILEPVEPVDRTRHAVVALERLAVPVEEPPVARAERARVLPHPHLGVEAARPAVVAHGVDVGTARRVGLGHHLTTVG